MELTPENKSTIDAKDHYSLLMHWRFAPPGDPWMVGATGEYWGKCLAAKRDANPGAAVANSKAIGWVCK